MDAGFTRRDQLAGGKGHDAFVFVGLSTAALDDGSFVVAKARRERPAWCRRRRFSHHKTV